MMDEQLGSYNPIATREGIKEVRLNVNRLQYWLSVGAQPSDRWVIIFIVASHDGCFCISSLNRGLMEEDGCGRR